MDSFLISKIQDEELDGFFTYLDNHLSENGKDGFFFQPMTNEQFNFDINWKTQFAVSLTKNFVDSGWRKLWIAKDEKNRILGHVDIRSRNELNTEHRVLLGLGVDSHCRNLKVGQKLVKFIVDYCILEPSISWVDLQVMSRNDSALKLYKNLNFKILSKVEDMFRFNNDSHGFISMTLKVGD